MVLAFGQALMGAKANGRISIKYNVQYTRNTNCASVSRMTSRELDLCCKFVGNTISIFWFLFPLSKKCFLYLKWFRFQQLVFLRCCIEVQTKVLSHIQGDLRSMVNGDHDSQLHLLLAHEINFTIIIFHIIGQLLLEVILSFQILFKIPNETSIKSQLLFLLAYVINSRI